MTHSLYLGIIEDTVVLLMQQQPKSSKWKKYSADRVAQPTVTSKYLMQVYLTR